MDVTEDDITGLVGEDEEAAEILRGGISDHEFAGLFGATMMPSLEDFVAEVMADTHSPRLRPPSPIDTESDDSDSVFSEVMERVSRELGEMPHEPVENRYHFWPISPYRQ
jgi:hypothetical protein